MGSKSSWALSAPQLSRAPQYFSGDEEPLFQLFKFWFCHNKFSLRSKCDAWNISSSQSSILFFTTAYHDWQALQCKHQQKSDWNPQNYYKLVLQEFKYFKSFFVNCGANDFLWPLTSFDNQTLIKATNWSLASICIVKAEQKSR